MRPLPYCWIPLISQDVVALISYLNQSSIPYQGRKCKEFQKIGGKRIFRSPPPRNLRGVSPAAPALDAARSDRPSGEPELHVPARTAACRLPAGVRRLRRGLCTGAAFAGLRCCVARRISRPVSVCARKRGAMHAKFRCAVTKTAAAGIEYTEKRTEAFPCPD